VRPEDPVSEEIEEMKKLLTMLFSVAIALSLTTVSFAQDTGGDKRMTLRRPDAKDKKPKAKKAKADKDKKSDDKMKGDCQMK
jgi:hypothetical protein